LRYSHSRSLLNSTKLHLKDWLILDFTYAQAVIIGFIQGITELFPISSLGHAILVPAWIGGSFAQFISEENKAYLLITIAMHLASSIALFIIFRRRWFGLIKGTFAAITTRNYQTTPFRVLGYIVIATIPVGALGIIFGDYFQSIFGKPVYSAAFLTINGLLLIGAERLSRRDIAHEFHDSDAEIDHRVNARTAVAIGFGQSLALFAGISRFGITMSAGLLRKLSHSVASDFAFLLSLPVIVGAAIVKLPELFTTDAKQLLGQILLGSIVSFIATYFSVTFLVRWFKTRTLYPFAIYCLFIGIASLVRFA
jgi:undecaprenyl-diphosphatase